MQPWRNSSVMDRPSFGRAMGGYYLLEEGHSWLPSRRQVSLTLRVLPSREPPLPRGRLPRRADPVPSWTSALLLQHRVDAGAHVPVGAGPHVFFIGTAHRTHCWSRPGARLRCPLLDVHDVTDRGRFVAVPELWREQNLRNRGPGAG